MSWTRLSFQLAGRAVLRPRLAVSLVRVAWRFRRRKWWQRVPFLPVPDAEYMRWRMHTAYGDERFIPPAEDIERFALWATSDI